MADREQLAADLAAARDMISDPSKYRGEQYAHDAAGVSLYGADIVRGVTFSACGAVRMSIKERIKRGQQHDIFSMWEELCGADEKRLGEIEDDPATAHKDVIGMFNNAIARLRA